MRPALYLSIVILGVAQLGLALASVRAMDAEINARQLRDESAGPQPRIAPPAVSDKLAVRISLISAGSALCGAGCIMVGSLLTALHIMSRYAMKSRLGTDEKPE